MTADPTKPHPRCYDSEKLDCSKCGKPTPIDLLDAKDDGTGNFTILECQSCYGPGWLPAFHAEHQQ